MLSIIATLVSILNGIFTLVKGLFGKSAPAGDPTAQAAAVENKIGQVSAQVSRDTTQELDKEIQDANSANDSAVDAVRTAHSVREQQSTVDDAINRANASAGSDR